MACSFGRYGMGPVCRFANALSRRRSIVGQVRGQEDLEVAVSSLERYLVGLCNV